MITKQLFTELPSPSNGDILISIRSEFAQKIYDGTKTIELRKHLPNINSFTYCWIYEPMPVGLITGYFVVAGTIVCQPKHLWDKYNKFLGIDKNRFFDYYEGRGFAYGILINWTKKLSKPYSLGDIGLTRPPQMYQRIRTI